MYALNTVDRSMRLVLEDAITTNQLTIVTAFEDRRNDSKIGATGSKQTTTNNTTIVTIVEAPTSGVSRQVHQITIYNADTAVATITVFYTAGATDFTAFTAELSVGDQAYYEYRTGWIVIDSSGNIKTNLNEGAQDAVGNILVDSASINFTYDDTTPSITAVVIPGGVDHGGLAGLTDDDHTQYALLAGRATGQTLVGGTAAGDDLTLRATANATDGDIIFQSDSAPTERARITSTGEVQINAGPLTGTTATPLIIIGGPDAGDDLTLRATSNATDGDIIFQSDSAPTERARITSTGEIQINGGPLTGTTTTPLTIIGGPDAGDDLILRAASNATDGDIIFQSDSTPTERMRIVNTGSVVIGTAALATTATDGFLYIPTCAGTPTGVPTAFTGLAPMVIDSTNNKLYFYSGGAWRDAGP